MLVANKNKVTEKVKLLFQPTELQVEVRGENKEINRFMCENAIRMAESAAHSFQLQMESEIMGEAVDLINDK